MKKHNSITIALILLAVLAHSFASALAESSAPFPDVEWNRTYVPAMDYTHWMAQTSDGGYIIIGSVDYFSHSREYIIVKNRCKRGSTVEQEIPGGGGKPGRISDANLYHADL